MRFIRPAQPGDLEALVELATLSGPGFTSLPLNEAALSARLKLSADSFAGHCPPGKAWYTLMLEDADSGRVDGVASVRAAIGVERPHFSFRVMTVAQHSPATQTRFDHRILVLVNECGGCTEVGSLFLRPEARSGGAGALLARARYLLIAADPGRFSPMVMAELRGWIGTDGSSPFWDGVSSKFFRLPFTQADRMVMSTDGQFIADLAPRHPIYVELLAADTAAVIGRCHRDGEAALAMLEKEGFARSGLVDVFDGGPTLLCPRDRIATVVGARRMRACIDPDARTGIAHCLSSAAIREFRALRADVASEGDHLLIKGEAAELLKIRNGDVLLVRGSA